MRQSSVRVMFPAMPGWGWPILSFIAIFLLAAPFFPTFPADSEAYRNIAQGLIAEVPKPFSNRVLLPLAARGLSKLLGLQIETCFSTIAILLYAALVVLVLTVTRRLRIDERVLALVWFIPLMTFTVTAVYLPDLAAMFWTILILWAIAFDRPWLAVLLLFPAIVTRENLTVLSAVLLLFFLLSRSFFLGAATVASVAAGLWLTAKLSAGSMSNVHEMNQIVYMLLKVPVNFVSNLIGIGFRITAFKSCDHPAIVVRAPEFLSLGNIDEIGICPFNGVELISGWLPYFSAFGIGAGVLLALMPWAKRFWRDLPMTVQVALIFGSIMFIIGPMSGKSVMRLTMYGWPAFLIALPYLSTRVSLVDRQVFFRLASLQIVCAWVAAPLAFPSLIDFFPSLLEQGALVKFESFALSIGLVANLTAFLICRRALISSKSAVLAKIV